MHVITFLQKKQHETPFLHMVENIIKDNFDKFHPVMQYKKVFFQNYCGNKEGTIFSMKLVEKLLFDHLTVKKSAEVITIQICSDLN